NSPLPSSQTSHPFSTYDKDNDGEDKLNCAALTRGGWWFDQCESLQNFWSNLNGEYLLHEDSTDSDYRGIRLADDWADFEVAGRTEMKLRRFLPNGSCNSEPCENGGTCLESDSSFYCECAPGFLGRRCEDKYGDPCSSDPCQNGGTCNQRQGHQSRQYCQCAPGFRGCRNLHFRGIRQSGVYTIYPSKYPDGLEVYCDMDTASGGWIVFQKRFDGSVNFTRNWTEYRNGFGNLTGEFWLGNEILHQLTSRGGGRWRQMVRIDLEDDQEENQTYEAKGFGISGENYTWTHRKPAHYRRGT
ncbi:ficolin-1-like, partial [Acanthaster planci]|uniref:Ficolin-1-like n=1 Tax=Acanthaster planci TaxID=133434 RepID=A0A8B7YTX4_ACAPL